MRREASSLRAAEARRLRITSAGVRPGRDNIAAPDLPEGISWVGAGAGVDAGADRRPGPALVHFIDFAQLNSVRTLPYLSEWSRRYREAGLSVIGVQAPRFPFGADETAVAAGLDGLGVEFPVAIDAERELWSAYGCEGWPSLFLWSLGGALSWVHFGEGEYLATEIAIQEELREIDALQAAARADGAAPAERRPRRPGDGAHPGGLPRRLLGAALDRRRGRRGAGGRVRGRRRLRHGRGSGRDRARAGRPRPASTVATAEPRPLRSRRAPQPRGARLTLRPTPGLRIWSVSFAAGHPWNKEKDHDHQARFRRHSLHRRRPLPRVLRRDARPAPRREGPVRVLGRARPASASGSRPRWAWSSRRRRTPTPPCTSTTSPPPGPSWRQGRRVQRRHLRHRRLPHGALHRPRRQRPDAAPPLRARATERERDGPARRLRRGRRAPRGSPSAA